MPHEDSTHLFIYFVFGAIYTMVGTHDGKRGGDKLTSRSLTFSGEV
jgi:hypothetical protein